MVISGHRLHSDIAERICNAKVTEGKRAGKREKKEARKNAERVVKKGPNLGLCACTKFRYCRFLTRPGVAQQRRWQINSAGVRLQYISWALKYFSIIFWSLGIPKMYTLLWFGIKSWPRKKCLKTGVFLG